jgi:hypothetical protein
MVVGNKKTLLVQVKTIVSVAANPMPFKVRACFAFHLLCVGKGTGAAFRTGAIFAPSMAW